MRHCAVVFALLCLAAPLLADDVTIVSTFTRNGGSPHTAASYLTPDHVRMAEGDGKEAIFDMKSGRMTMLDTAKKTYFVMTRDELTKMAAKSLQMMNTPEMKKAMEQLNTLPPEQRKSVQALMDGMFKVSVEKSGRTRRIAGLPCEEWVVTVGQLSRTEQCMTKELKLPQLSWETLQQAQDASKAMLAAMGPMGKHFEEMREQFKKMSGFPLAKTTTVEAMGQKVVTTSEVTEIKYGPVPSSAWQIPAGYSEVASPLTVMEQHTTK